MQSYMSRNNNGTVGNSGKWTAPPTLPSGSCTCPLSSSCSTSHYLSVAVFMCIVLVFLNTFLLCPVSLNLIFSFSSS